MNIPDLSQNLKALLFKRYEWYEEYDSNENLLSIQDQLIASISEQIIINIFNDAFTNW